MRSGSRKCTCLICQDSGLEAGCAQHRKGAREGETTFYRIAELHYESMEASEKAKAWREKNPVSRREALKAKRISNSTWSANPRNSISGRRMKTLSESYADFIVRTRFEDLGEEVVQQAKKLILDLVGVSLPAMPPWSFRRS